MLTKDRRHRHLAVPPVFSFWYSLLLSADAAVSRFPFACLPQVPILQMTIKQHAAISCMTRLFVSQTNCQIIRERAVRALGVLLASLFAVADLPALSVMSFVFSFALRCLFFAGFCFLYRLRFFFAGSCARGKMPVSANGEDAFRQDAPALFRFRTASLFLLCQRQFRKKTGVRGDHMLSCPSALALLSVCFIKRDTEDLVVLTA